MSVMPNLTLTSFVNHSSVYIHSDVTGNESDYYKVLDNVTSGRSHDADLQRLKDFSNACQLYLLPVIISVGFLGNSVSLLVLLRTYMRRLSVSVYLASLSVADTVFLATLLIIWLEHLDLRVFNRQGICQATLYLSYSSSFLSVWSVVGFSTERLIAICFPL